MSLKNLQSYVHLAVTHYGGPRPERGGRPLVVEGGSYSPGLQLGPVTEVEAGAVQQMVVGSWEAVDQVERQTAEEGGEGVLDHPPGLVREERGGEGAGDESRVVGGQDRVKEDLLEPHVEVRLGDGHLHADELGRGMNPSRGGQVGPKGSELVFVNFHPALITRGEVNEGRGGGSEQNEVHTDRVDKIEDVDHAVALLDEEHHVAEDKKDQPDRAVLGAIDEPPDGGHREDGDEEQAEQQPDEPPAEHHQREGDGWEVYQVEVHRLAVIAVRQPPHRPAAEFK